MILAGAIIVVMRGFLLRPLDVIDRRFAAMAAGERAMPMEDGDKFCPEIQRVDRPLRTDAAREARGSAGT